MSAPRRQQGAIPKSSRAQITPGTCARPDVRRSGQIPTALNFEDDEVIEAPQISSRRPASKIATRTVKTLQNARGQTLQTETYEEDFDPSTGVKTKTCTVQPAGSSASLRGPQRPSQIGTPGGRPPPPQGPAKARQLSRPAAIGTTPVAPRAVPMYRTPYRPEAPIYYPKTPIRKQMVEERTVPGGNIARTQVDTSIEPGKTVKVTKVSKVRQQPSPMSMGTPRGASSTSMTGRTIKMITTSEESLGRSIHKKKMKIVESSTSVASTASRGAFVTPSRPTPRKPPKSTPSKVVRKKKASAPQLSNRQLLDMDIERELREMSVQAAQQKLEATGALTAMVSPPKMQTPIGEVVVEKRVIAKKSVIREPDQPEIIASSLTGMVTVSPDRAHLSEVQVQRLDPSNRNPEGITGREVSEVINTISVSRGFVETSRTVVIDAPVKPPKKPQLSPRQVAQLVAEENAEVAKAQALIMPDLEASRPVTHSLRSNVEMEQLRPESVTLLEQSVVPILPTADTEEEEPEPEMIASMMNTEERGLKMDAPPQDIHNYLFMDEKDDCLLDVSSAAASPLNDIVVPMNMPDIAQEVIDNPEVVQATRELALTIEDDVVPENLYVETVGKEIPETKNTAKLGETKTVTFKGRMLSKVIPPWGIKNYKPIVDVVGAPPGLGLYEIPDDEEVPAEVDPTVDGIEYMLQMEPPRHSSKVQLRGTNNPSWFPGYYLALPKIPEYLTVVKSPSLVFSTAWQAMQPDLFTEDSIIMA